MTGTVRPRAAAAATALLLALAGCAREPSPAPRSPPTVAERIRYHEARVLAEPRLYPEHALLAEALLDRARTSRSAGDLARAEQHLRLSLGIQESFQALKTMAALHAFRHRFEDALAFAARAAAAHPPDTSLLALKVESLLALGRGEEAAELLAGSATAEPEFYYLASLGKLRTAEGELEDAVLAFESAAAEALRRKVPSLAAWARIRAAAVWIDSGAAARALPHLDAAAALAPDDPDLLIHRSEAAEAAGDLEAALALVDRVLAAHEDPTARARAARLERLLGHSGRAARHFEAARSAFEAALDAGEVYTLGSLAALLADAGQDLPRARDLARRNVEVQPNAEARALLERIEALIAR